MSSRYHTEEDAFVNGNKGSNNYQCNHNNYLPRTRASGNGRRVDPALYDERNPFKDPPTSRKGDIDGINEHEGIEEAEEEEDVVSSSSSTPGSILSAIPQLSSGDHDNDNDNYWDFIENQEDSSDSPASTTYSDSGSDQEEGDGDRLYLQSVLDRAATSAPPLTPFLEEDPHSDLDPPNDTTTTTTDFDNPNIQQPFPIAYLLPAYFEASCVGSLSHPKYPSSVPRNLRINLPLPQASHSSEPEKKIHSPLRQSHTSLWELRGEQK